MGWGGVGIHGYFPDVKLLAGWLAGLLSLLFCFEVLLFFEFFWPGEIGVLFVLTVLFFFFFLLSLLWILWILCLLFIVHCLVLSFRLGLGWGWRYWGIILFCIGRYTCFMCCLWISGTWKVYCVYVHVPERCGSLMREYGM